MLQMHGQVLRLFGADSVRFDARPHAPPLRSRRIRRLSHRSRAKNERRLPRTYRVSQVCDNGVVNITQ